MGRDLSQRLRDVIAENKRREGEALRLWRPMATQLPFLLSDASERVIRGGVRCLGWMQRIYDPIDGTNIPVCERTKPFHVMSVNPTTGKQEIKRASAAFKKGTDRLYRLHLANGESFTATRTHTVLSSSGWTSVSSFLRGCELSLPVSNSDTCLPAFLPDAPHSMQITPGSPACCHREYRSSDAQLPRQSEIVPGCVPSLGDVHEHIPMNLTQDALACERAYIHPCLASYPLSSSDVGFPACHHTFASSIPVSWKSYASAFQTHRTYRLAGIATNHLLRTSVEPPQKEYHTSLADSSVGLPVGEDGVLRCMGHTQAVCQSILNQDPDHTTEPFRQRRTSIPSCYPPGESECSSTIVTSTDYIGKGDFYDFEVEDNHNYILGGVVHHNSGKTTLATAEVASAATGIPLTGLDGTELPYRYPRDEPGKPRKPLVIWIIGYDQPHIARVYKYLFVPGAFQKFRILEDPDTGELRSWRPWEERDAALEHLTRPHPPMIPERFCPRDTPPGPGKPGIAYESKGEHIFSLAVLSNGTEIYAMPSGGNPGMGVAVDLIWIDEDIKYPGHVQEWQSRLSDVQGRLIWSAWPWSDNEALTLMSKRAEDDSKLEHPDITETVLKFSKNPFMPKDEIRKRLKAWRADGEATVRARDGGEFLTGLSRVFPNFDIDLHGVPCMDHEDDPLDRALARNGYHIPDDWTHYLGVDPGFAHMALVLAAVPPPDVGDFYVVYDEIYLERAVPADAVRELLKRMKGQRFHSFIMDAHMGRQTHTSGKTVCQQWQEEFAKKDIKSRLTYSGFMWGSDNIFARNLIVRRALEPREDGTTKFRIFKDTTRYMQEEFRKYKRQPSREEDTEKIADRFNHLMDANGYIMASHPTYFVPPVEERKQDPIMKTLELLRRRGKPLPQSDFIYMGAGAAPVNPFV